MGSITPERSQPFRPNSTAACECFFNQEIAYADDLENWGVADYWATPMETLAKGQRRL